MCYSELAYVVGVVTLALGSALMERADLGISMVVAPAYLLHLKISQYFPAYTFGMSEYVLQAVLILAMSAILRKFKISYLFSFVTAVFYGFMLDLFIRAAVFLPDDAVAWRLVWYSAGVLLCATGVAFFFHTYISPAAYELFVKELSTKFNLRIDRVKTTYDCCSCLVAIALSFAFFGFGHFEGVKVGTIVCAAVNGWLIGRISNGIESRYTIRDALPFRDKFCN